jgi:hypothetical protein
MRRPSPTNIIFTFLTVLLAALFTLSQSSAISTKGGHGFPDIPVTSTLNATGSVTPNPGTNYRIQNDGNGQYFDGVTGVSSILQGGINSASRDWILDTRLTTTTRTVLIDLRAPVPNSGAVQIFSWQPVPTRIIVKCLLTLSGSFPAIPLNQTVSCPMFVSFLYGGTEYRLVMSSAPGTSADFPETNNARVTCNAANASNQCTAWTVLPITQADGTVQDVARLQTASKSGKWSDSGDFYMTFNFTVTNP